MLIECDDTNVVFSAIIGENVLGFLKRKNRVG